MSNGFFFFDEAPHSISKRFFRIPAIGDGGNIESLSSYLKRLAFAHRMNVRTLATELVSSPDGSTQTIGLQREWLRRNGQDFIGISGQTKMMIEKTELNTGVTDLHLCTMTSLEHFLCLQRLVTDSRRVCLECLNEDQEQGRPMYERLLWRLEAVSACDVHRCALIEPRCGRGGRKKAVPHLPGVCGTCGSIGFLCRVCGNDPTCSDSDIWVARQCRQLLEARPLLAKADPLRMKAALRAMWTARGAMAAAAKQADIQHSSLYTWLSKPDRKTSLYRLTDIALMFQLDLVSLFLGNVEPSLAPANRSPRLGKQIFRRPNHEAIAQRLEAALEAGESATHVANELDVFLCSVSRHKGLYRRVADRARAKRRDQDSRRRRAAVLEAEDAIIRLLRKKKVPSVRNASLETGVHWNTRSLKALALTSIRVRLGHTGVQLPPTSPYFSAELQGMLDESAARILQHLGH